MNPSPGLCCTTTLPTHVSNMHVKPVFTLLGRIEEWAFVICLPGARGPDLPCTVGPILQFAVGGRVR